MAWCREISEDVSDQLNDIRRDLDDSMSDIAQKHPKFRMKFPINSLPPPFVTGSLLTEVQYYFGAYINPLSPNYICP